MACDKWKCRCNKEERYDGNTKYDYNEEKIDVTSDNNLNNKIHPKNESLSSNSKLVDEEKKYYILNISAQTDLTNGFRYIKELLLQHHNYKMYSDYNKLINAGIDVYSVKTDAFTINREHFELAKQTIKFTKKNGGWGKSKDEHINFPIQNFTIVNNKEILIEEPQFERILINDEWDVNEICQAFIKYKHVIVRADLQGSGKSYAAEQMAKLGYKVLFVCPTNVLTQIHGENGITVNSFFWYGYH